MTDDPTLLIADEDAEVLALVERAAEPLGFRTVRHAGGGAVLAALPSIKPDAVLLDLGEIDAATALREIHAIDSQCAVILMTGEPTSTWRFQPSRPARSTT